MKTLLIGMAAMTILGVPNLIVFLLLQRYFMEGVISTGIKRQLR